jgi:hypothetical protein
MKSSYPFMLMLSLTLMLLAAPAFAYIDPGTGSFLVQGVIAAVIGVGVATKLFWAKIKAALTGNPIEENDDDDDE